MAPAALAQDKTPATAKQSPREIIAAVPRSWPPQYNVDENGKPIGFAIDVMEEIAALANVRVTYRVFDAFADVSEVMRKGEAHIIPNSGITADRTAKYFFTAPVETFVVSIFVRRDTIDINGMEDLVGRRVGVVEHNISEKLLKPRKDIKSVVHRDAVTALFDLLSGDEDALIFPEPVMLHLARKVGVEDRIRIVSEPLKELKRAIRVQRSEPELFAALDKAVKSFVGSPAYRRIYLKWYGKPQPFWTAARVAWTMGVLMTIFLLFMGWWRYRVGVRLNRALRESEARFKDIAEAATDRFWEMDENLVFTANIEYRGKDVSPPPEHFIGRTRWEAARADPEKNEKWRRHREDLLARRPFRDFQYSVTGEDGETHHLSVSGTPVFDDAGVFKGYRGSATNITERKLVEEALENSEARLRRSVLDAPIPVIMHAEDGEVLMISNKWTELSGYSHLDIPTIRDWMEKAYGADKQHMERQGEVENALYDLKEPSQHEAHITTASGEKRTWEVRDAPLGRLPDGRRFVISMAVDVTERRQAEESLKESEKRFKDFAEAASDWFWEMDENLRFTAFSERRQELTGLLPNENVGKTRWEVAGADPDEDEYWRQHRATLEANEPFRDFEYDFTEVHGRHSFVSVSGKPIFNEAGVFKGYRGTATDITERKQVEGALQESEERFRNFIDNSPSYMIIKDIDGRIQISNKKHAEYFGIKRSDVIGKTTFEFLPENLAKKAVAHDQRVLEKQSELTEERQIFTNQEARDFNITKFPIFDDSDTIVGIGTIGTDITERKQAEEMRDRLSQAVENVPVGIALFDRDDRLVFFNNRYGEIMEAMADDLKPGLAFEELIRTIVDRHPVKEAQGREEEFIRERIKHHRNPTGPMILSREDGYLMVDDLHLPDGSIFTIFSDVTKQKQAEEDRNKALVDAEQANQAKSEFLATMSHELRTPLNAILGFSDILSHQYFGPPGAEKYREYAEDIHASGEHLMELVNEILDLSTIEAGKQSLVKENLATKEVVKECVRIVGEKAYRSGIDLFTKVTKDLPPLYVDKRAFKQILLNLLSNAVKFTPEGGKITVSVKASKKNTTLKVADTGKGISAENLPKLTDPFTRADTDPYLAEQGWGLGLTITKSLIDLHDGTLEIKSKVGKGTTVTVTFPNSAP